MLVAHTPAATERSCHGLQCDEPPPRPPSIIRSSADHHRVDLIQLAASTSVRCLSETLNVRCREGIYAAIKQHYGSSSAGQALTTTGSSTT